jgi:hypothetical protein
MKDVKIVAVDSRIEKREKTTQYVNHWMLSAESTESIALNDMYAGYKNPRRSDISFAPPITHIKKIVTDENTVKKIAFGTSYFDSNCFNLSAN